MEFILDLEINKKLIEYIELNNIENKNKFINDIINLGFESYKIKDESKNNNLLLANINNIINNNNNNLYQIINEIKCNTNEITKNFSKSIIKGNYGENIINNYISNNYPTYDLLDMSKISHSGDFHLYMTDINEKIIIEVKTYNEVVNQNEINKLKRDMEYTGINYSIMISLCSKIVGKKQNIEWEIYKNNENIDNVIIFISDTHSNIDYIQISLTIMKSFINMLNKQNLNDNTMMYLNNFTKQSYININNNINNLIYLKESINKIKNNIYNVHDNISKQILDLYHTFTLFDNEYNNKIRLLQNNLIQDFKNITNIIDNENNDDIYLFLDNYKDNKNIYKVLQLIISDIISNNYTFKIKKDELNIISNNNINLGKINILKTKIDIVFSDGGQLKNININNWNKYKNLF